MEKIDGYYWYWVERIGNNLYTNLIRSFDTLCMYRKYNFTIIDAESLKDDCNVPDRVLVRIKPPKPKRGTRNKTIKKTTNKTRKAVCK
jgi:hypothetical protein